MCQEFYNMKIKSVKQYIKYAAPLAAVVILAGSLVAAPIMSMGTTEAASGWTTKAGCAKEAASSSNDTYFNNCLNTRSVEGMVFRAYRTILNRNPDANGFKYWVTASETNVKNGKDPVAPVIKVLLNSSEAGKKGLRTENTRVFVQTIYLNALRRNADTAGLNYWANQIDRRDGKAKTRAAVAGTFAQNAEAKRIWSLEAPCYITNYDSRYCAD